MTNQERQRAYRERQALEGRKPQTLYLTDDERFYVDRIIQQMRRNGSIPAQMRRKNGTLEPLDA